MTGRTWMAVAVAVAVAVVVAGATGARAATTGTPSPAAPRPCPEPLALCACTATEVSCHPGTTYSALGELPANTFSDFTATLTRILLPSIGITHLTPGVFDGLGRLQFLNLGGNALTAIPSGAFRPLPNLSTLIVSRNNLTSLEPDLLRGLTQLSALEADCNALQSLPRGLLAGLTMLVSVDFGRNNLTALPPDLLSDARNVRVVDLGFNQLTAVPAALFAVTDQASTVNLNNNSLTSLPEGIFANLTQLRVIDLSANRLTALPELLLASVQPMIAQLVFLQNNELDNATNVATAISVPDFILSPFLITLSFNPISCSFEQTLFDFTCRCSSLFEVRDGLCRRPVSSKQDIVPVAVGSVFGGLVGGALIVVLALWLQRRFRGLRVELDLRQSLLESQEMENIELKRAWDIDPRDVDLGRRIDGDSPGTFGEVWYAEWDGLGVAVKRLRLAMAELDATAGREFETEVDLLRKCRHRNIVRFFGAGTWDEGRGLPFLVTEYLENGAMSTYLRAHGGEIGWAQKRRWCVEIQAGMEYIHGLGRIHRDLKTGNVLLSLRLRAKIADFGSMKDILVGGGGGGRGGGGGAAAMMAAGLGGDASTRTMTAGVGTPLYMAPEIMRGERYGPSADVWSLGVVVWEIATQERPDLAEYVGAEEGFSWSGPFMSRLEAALVAGHRLPVARLPDLLRPIVATCWGLAPLGRPSIGEVGEMLAGFAEAAVV